jgi:membrane-associated protease RseP (regulator of RpoE activity)
MAMRTPKLLMLGVLLSLAAPSLLAHTAPAPRASKAPRAPRAPRHAPEAPMPPDAPAPPGFPVPPDMSEAPMAWTMAIGQPKARLGTQVSSMTSELRKFFGAPADVGLLVQHIEPGSAAEAAKVAVGDVLVEVDGQRIEQVSDVRDALADRAKGDVVAVVVVRKHKRKKLKATLTNDAGPTAFSMPGMQAFELPPEARRFMSAEAQAELQQELDQVREELREVERQLGELHGPGAMRTPEPPTPPRSPKAKGKSKGERAKQKPQQ